MLRRKNFISGSVIFIVSLLMMIHSFSIRLTNIDKIVGSRLFPQIILALLMIFSLWLIAGEVRQQRKGIVGDADEGGERAVLLKVGLVFLALAVYIILLGSAGFLIGTILYLFSQMYLLEAREGRHYLQYAVLSVIVTAAIYLIFTKGFHLVLPRGNLF